MPRSMTGFGRAEAQNGRYDISVEIRTLNNRYLDIGLKLPRALNTYEYVLKELIKKKIVRGKLTAAVGFKNLSIKNNEFRLNEDIVQFYFKLLGQIKSQTGLKEDISLAHLLQFKELVEPEEAVLEDEQVESLLISVFETALDNLNQMREKEAKNIGTDILNRLNTIESILSEINEKAKETSRIELDKLYSRIKNRIRIGEVDRDRLEQELALIADRVDITEECIRLQSHLTLFKDALLNKKEVGKQLTFILQEMHRETNTIGSKTSDVKISHNMISMKEEIEKLREQVQNLE